MSPDVILTPQVIGRAESAHGPLLDRVLARAGTTFHQWVALTLTAAAGGAVTRDELIGAMADARKISPATAAAAVSELTASGLLEIAGPDGSRLRLTAPGRARHQQIRAEVDEVIARVYRDIPAGDLVTAGRVLTAITARANAELSRP